MLNGATSTGNILLARNNNAVAISKEINQLLIDVDYRSIKNLMVHQLLANIVTRSNISIDSFNTSTPLSAGDEIIIKKADGKYYSLILDSNMITTNIDASNLIPVMISNNSPSGLLTPFSGSNSIYLCFTTNKNNTSYSISNDIKTFTYQFENNDPVLIKKIYCKLEISNSNCTLYGSNNGIDFTSLGTTNTGKILTYSFTHDIAYSYYKFVFSNPSGYQTFVQNIELLGAGYTIDTSSITNGEIPTEVYKCNKFKFNEIYATEDISRRHIEDSYSGYSKLIARYNDIIFYPARNIVTQVELPVAGNQITEVTAEIYKLDLKIGNEIHTANLTNGNLITVSGTNTIPLADAYKVFDGDSINDGFREPSGTDGIVDIVHVYEFDIPTTCYGINLVSGLAQEAIAAFKVSGSFNGIDYIELLNETQSIAVDNINLKRYFNINLYDAYKFYKIEVTKGNTENDFVSVKEYQLLTEV